MPKQIVVLSGHVCSGKTTLAGRLHGDYGLIHLKTLDCLRSLNRKTELSRTALQALGERLDRKTDGAWVRDALNEILQKEAISGDSIVIVDAVRIKGQVKAIRESFGRRLIHVHLTAPLKVLEKRYKNRKSGAIREMGTYAEVQANKTESQVDQLAKTADMVIDTQQCTEDDVVIRVAADLGLYGREYLRLVDVLVGGQFGSEGKGHIAAHLAPEYDVLVRIGGPNAGHTVYEEPKPYTFYHLPSGTRVNSTARVLIAPGAVLYVPKLQQEIGDCHLDVDRLCIDPQAMIISEDDRTREAALKANIGSTGQGVGAATARKIMDRGEEKVLLARDIAKSRS